MVYFIAFLFFWEGFENALGFPGGSVVKNPLGNLPRRETQVQSLGGNIPWRRKWQLIAVFLPGNPQGQRSLAGYGPLGLKVRHNLETKQQQQQQICPSILFF